MSLQPSSDAAEMLMWSSCSAAITISSKILISLIVDADGSSGRDQRSNDRSS